MRRNRHHAEPGKGALRIVRGSSLRKLMRAAARGKIPDERLVIIQTAMSRARDRNAR